MNMERIRVRRRVEPDKVYSALEKEIMIKFLENPKTMPELAGEYGMSIYKVRKITNDVISMSNKDRDQFVKQHKNPVS